MSKSILSDPRFHDEEAAYAWVEARVWAAGRVCPHCGVVGDSGKLKGKSTRPGVYKCYACRKPFTVKVGTIFEASHIALHLWLQAMALVASSKKGISANQLSRTLGVTLKSAWFMGHRIREAMTGSSSGLMGEGGGAVEMDETYWGRDRTKPRKYGRENMGPSSKLKVISLVERGGAARSFHVEAINGPEALKILLDNVSPDARLMTDEGRIYQGFRKYVASHETVQHNVDEFVRGEAHTNNIEGFFGVFKRGMRGVYQHCDQRHLHRYLAEFDFRYTNRAATGVDDAARTEKLVKGVSGKRLTYRTTRRGAAQAR